MYVDDVYAPTTCSEIAANEEVLGNSQSVGNLVRVFVYMIVHVSLKAEGTERTLQHLIIRGWVLLNSLPNNSDHL